MSDRLVDHGGISAADGHGLQVIMRSAMRGAQGDFALVALRVDDERLIIQSGEGLPAENMVGNLMLVRDSVAAPVFLVGSPLLVADYPQRGGAAPEVRAEIGSVIVVPLQAGGQVEGALAIGRLVGRAVFTEPDLEQLMAFVARTGTARELHGAREERRIARLLEERARIRDDLHDNVIQELFAVGMALQAAARRTADDDLRAVIGDQVDALDAAATRIRLLISDMPMIDLESAALPLTKRLVAIVDSLTVALGCLPTVTFVGPVESTIEGDLAKDIEAVLREALSNVAKHAGASRVQVRVSVDDKDLVLDVVDNGRGIGPTTRSSGLTNIRRRAVRHGGDLSVSSPPEGGTHLSWHVVLHR
ncbi:MAG TPA: ATP-binding protein [Jatrophihabitans sp.]|nr:ATP-binding protein [Jatrophihabitans sp.]